MSAPAITGYVDHAPELEHAHQFLLPVVFRALGTPGRVFDLGCGNGAVAQALHDRGYQVTGVDPSESGIAYAHANRPQLDLHQGSAYEPLAERFGRFPSVVSLEVVEHVYAPRDYAATLFDLVEPGGQAIISTPYHGYWKNLAVALAGGFDAHFTALWDNGHIKFWSVATLTQLLTEAGFRNIRFERVGRIPPLARSMIAIADKP